MFSYSDFWSVRIEVITVDCLSTYGGSIPPQTAKYGCWSKQHLGPLRNSGKALEKLGHLGGATNNYGLFKTQDTQKQNVKQEQLNVQSTANQFCVFPNSSVGRVADC